MSCASATSADPDYQRVRVFEHRGPEHTALESRPAVSASPPAALAALTTVTLDHRALDDFTAAFNRSDLDAVIAAFSDDAEYLPGDGRAHRGRAAIRAAFAPQFSGAFRRDALRSPRSSDRRARAQGHARWIAATTSPARTPAAPRPSCAGSSAPATAHASAGTARDVFHFDAAGKITGKYTYANYTAPRLDAALGVPLLIPARRPAATPQPRRAQPPYSAAIRSAYFAAIGCAGASSWTSARRRPGATRRATARTA